MFELNSMSLMFFFSSNDRGVTERTARSVLDFLVESVPFADATHPEMIIGDRTAGDQTNRLFPVDQINRLCF